MPYATATDGTGLYYRTAGAGEPLLLVSGQGGDHRDWDRVLDDYAARFRVITYDHRGTGRSEAPRRPPYTTRLFAADAVAVLDAAGVERAHAFGFSMGGRIGQWLGIDHAERVGGLVLCATTPGDLHGIARPAEVDALMAARPSPANDAAMRRLMHSDAWLAGHPEPPEVREIPPYARRLHYAASQGHDAWDLLPRISAPTLVVHGTDDVVNPTANAALLADRIPGAELLLVEGARHVCFEDGQAEVTQAVTAFLRAPRR